MHVALDHCLRTQHTSADQKVVPASIPYRTNPPPSPADCLHGKVQNTPARGVQPGKQVISRSHWAEIVLTGNAGLYFQYTAVALECDLFPSAAWGAAGGGVSPVGAAVRWWAAGA